ncbi:OmpA family protein [Flavobacterium sp. MFBS3-15]|jgi:outer membrane protein OmpA-like peptidoglycan-associated protein|uniref:OmpA family protein n=1 Tax=Flavobacterium sp. MFBS3-15 TaxID=2989816 RepID=UPI0022365310|nr:OmpA family protein [Flavobacterium sp. MFBS3-15]MCW4470399.1 OmpA family protein [Flavobacterium sp. MFBS3-15]
MKKLFYLAVLLLVQPLIAQEETLYSIYFEFDKYNLDDKQGNNVVAFIKAIDTTRIETIQIFGYCDDRGKDEYNFKLSTKRANTIRDTLIGRGIKNKIIVTIEGKGRIMLDEDIDNISEARSKNRRVDVVVNFRPAPPPKLDPGFYNTIKKDMIVGDHIYLENILFERGSSKLTAKSRTELEKVARLLQKYKNLSFEIQGHICCTPSFHKEAIDKDTKKRELSTNRALTVYKFLASKNIPKTRMVYKGYGNTKPLGKGSEYDRRVELVITKI